MRLLDAAFISNTCCPGHTDTGGMPKECFWKYLLEDLQVLKKHIKVYVPKSAMKHVQQGCGYVVVGKHFSLNYFVFCFLLFEGEKLQYPHPQPLL